MELENKIRLLNDNLRAYNLYTEFNRLYKYLVDITLDSNESISTRDSVRVFLSSVKYIEFETEEEYNDNGGTYEYISDYFLYGHDNKILNISDTIYEILETFYFDSDYFNHKFLITDQNPMTYFFENCVDIKES